MDDYPRMLYRHPSEGGTNAANLQDGAYDTLIVPGELEHQDAAGDGWCDTPADALDASPDKPAAPKSKKKG